MTTILSPSLIAAIAQTSGPLGVASAPDGVEPAAFGAAARLRGGVSLFVARDESRAAAFEGAARFFIPDLETARLPAWDSLPYDRISPTPAVAAQRCAVLTRLAARKPGDGALLVVTTASAVAQRVPPRSRLAAGAFSARVGAVVSPEDIETYAQMNGYGRASTVRPAARYWLAPAKTWDS